MYGDMYQFEVKKYEMWIMNSIIFKITLLLDLQIAKKRSSQLL
jgi:hypothetical protein